MNAFLASPYGVTLLVLVVLSFDCPAGCFLLSLVLGFAALLARPLALGADLTLVLPLRVSPLTESLAGRLQVQVPIDIPQDIPQGIQLQCGFIPSSMTNKRITLILNDFEFLSSSLS